MRTLEMGASQCAILATQRIVGLIFKLEEVKCF